MKRLTLLLILALVCVAGVGCDSEYPFSKQDVAFVEYSLEEWPFCEWQNLDYFNNAKGTVLVINSDEELKNYIKGEYPPVDFLKSTLLLAYGEENYFVKPDYTNLQTSLNNYLMTVNLAPSLMPAVTPWQVSITVDKLNKNSTVKLNITKKLK